MKIHNNIKIFIALVGAGIFNLLFWKQSIGVNLYIYTFFLITIALIAQKANIKSKALIASLLGVVITGFGVVYHNSVMTIFSHIASCVILIGFIHQDKLNSILYALPTAFNNLLKTPKRMVTNVDITGLQKNRVKGILQNIKLSLIPIIILALFYLIFSYANPVFNDLSANFWDFIGKNFEVFFENISFLQIVLFICGLILTGWALYKGVSKRYLRKEQELSDTIVRVQNELLSEEDQEFRANSTANNYKSGLILISMVNVLLLIVNMIDINWIWINFQYTPGVNLTQLVHEGTYLLILSILIAIGIILYFYRGEINFYKNNKLLTILSTVWIAQNAILVVSVAIRNFHYIEYFGLAYKRIGVIFFLLLTLFGLFTLLIKIRNKKSSFYLLRLNSWALFAVFIIMSIPDWDSIIMKNNVQLEHKQNLDINFLLSLSDKTLPILNENKHILQVKNWQYSNNNFEFKFRNRVNTFVNEEELSWQSWSYKENKAFKYFKNLQINEQKELEK